MWKDMFIFAGQNTMELREQFFLFHKRPFGTWREQFDLVDGRK
jgi:hypothetical protein